MISRTLRIATPYSPFASKNERYLPPRSLPDPESPASGSSVAAVAVLSVAVVMFAYSYARAGHSCVSATVSSVESWSGSGDSVSDAGLVPLGDRALIEPRQAAPFSTANPDISRISPTRPSPSIAAPEMPRSFSNFSPSDLMTTCCWPINSSTISPTGTPSHWAMTTMASHGSTRGVRPNNCPS